MIFFFFFKSETNNCIKIEKHEKDEKSSPRCTNLFKKLRKPPLYKEGYTKRQKAYTRIMNSDPIDLTLRCVNRQLVKLNYTQMIGFKKVYTVSPKRNIKLKRIPHQLWRPPSVVENPSIPLSTHNPQQRETCYLLESPVFDRIPKTLKGDHHHIKNTAWLNLIDPRLRKDPMPQT